MLDLYIQITVALLLAFLLGFLIAKMWVQNRQNEYLAKFTQSEVKLETEKEFRQQQTHKIELLQDREQQLTSTMDELTSIKTTLNVEVTALNKSLENKQNDYLEKTTQLEARLKTEKEFKEQQINKFQLLQDKELQLINAVDKLMLTKTSLDEEVIALNKTLEKNEKQLEIESTRNNELSINLQLTTEEKNFLNSQIKILTENNQISLKTIEFMKEQASTLATQQDQLQQSLEQSTQQYESMDCQINTLSLNERDSLEIIHNMEIKYSDLKTENKSVEEEKIDYCDQLFIANNERVELEAHTLVRNHTFGAMSVAIIPIPFVDLATLLAIQIKMLRTLAEQYQIPFAENQVKSLIFPLLSSTLTITGAIIFSSFIKIIPGIGQASGMVSISILAGTTTYAVGEIFIEHFESGGTFLNFDVEKQKVRFKELYEKGKQVLVDSK